MAGKADVQGMVVSDKMQKSIIVSTERRVQHDVYGKTQKRTSTFVAHDEITGEDWSWHQHNYVRLDPGHEPAHIISVRSHR